MYLSILFFLISLTLNAQPLNPDGPVYGDYGHGHDNGDEGNVGDEGGSHRPDHDGPGEGHGPLNRPLQPGDHIIDNTMPWIGPVLRILPDAKISYRLDTFSGESTGNASDFSISVRCNYGVCRHDRVIDWSDKMERATEVFANGKSTFLTDSFHSLSFLDNIKAGVGYRCVENFCIGDTVMGRFNRQGTAQEIFSNGKVDVFYGSLSRDSRIESFDDLNLNLGCKVGANCYFYN